MMIQTAPAGSPRLAVMMHEHNALCQQFAYAFGNEQFQPLAPLDLMVYVIAHHDAGWLEFDRDPVIDESTGLPYNLSDTPARYIVRTSQLSPDFNQQHHAYCGLISSMHSWGLYNGRYGLSNLVLLEKQNVEDRPRVEQMLAGELDRQERLKATLAKDPATAGWLDQRKIMQNYKQLQFIDTLSLYFHRIHPSERGEQDFPSVPVSPDKDVTVHIKPAGKDTYALAPFPFASNGSEFAFAGHFIRPETKDWPTTLRQAPASWESFRLVAG